MDRQKKSNIITVIIIILIAIISYFSLIPQNENKTDQQIIECIAKNSHLYIQLGCSHCQKQKEILGENYNLFKTTDCFYEIEKCSKIQATPTWEINGRKIIGVQTIEQLRKLTKC